ncbi:riboflavin transporter Mch5p [Trichomonascus vanleenenianus]|uniref:MCT family MFS transporter n=1 Tax=Trichomonascus vanleenenianus TaxID=2268995 RepID=UPI003ECA469E
MIRDQIYTEEIAQSADLSAEFHDYAEVPTSNEDSILSATTSIISKAVQIHTRADDNQLCTNPITLTDGGYIGPSKNSNESVKPANNHNTKASTQAFSIENSEVEEEDEFPEGGWIAWRVVLGSFFGLTAIFGIVNSLGAVQAYIEENQLRQYSTSKVSWIFSIYSFVYLFFANEAGQFFDAYGPSHLVVVGSSIHVFCLFMTSLCTKYYQFILAFGVGAGLGASMLMTPFIAVVGHWFNKKRGVATTVATIGGSVGGLIMPIMLRSLYSKVGFGWAIRCLAFMSTMLLILAFILIRPRLEQKSLKLHPRNIIDLGAFKDKRFIFLTLMTLSLELALLIGVTFLPSYCLAQGMSQTQAYLMLALMNALGIPGRYISGLAADRYGRYNTMSAFCILGMASIFVVWLPFGDKYVAMVIFTLLFGFATGTVISLTGVCFGQICKIEDYGKRFGTIYTVSAFAPLFGIPLSGLLIRGTDYQNLIIVCGVLFFVAFASAVMTRYLSVGWRWMKF